MIVEWRQNRLQPNPSQITGDTMTRTALLEILESRGFVQFLADRLKQLRNSAEASSILGGEKYEDVDLVHRIQCDREEVFTKQLSSLFEERVIAQLGPFAPITSDELLKLAFEQLSGVPTGEHEFESALARFRQHIAVLVRSSTNYDKREIDLGYWNVKPNSEDLGKKDYLGLHFGELTGSGLRIYGSESDLQILVRFFCLEECHEAWEAGQAVCLIDGAFSPLALAESEIVLTPVIKSIAQTVKIVSGNPPYRLESGGRSNFPRIDNLIGGSGKDLFATCLSCYLERPPGTKSGNTTEQRIRNAIELLCEADSQKNIAIGLSLCFSAIEALVCDKQEGITDQLARNVVVLLEPDRTRRNDYVKAVKDLYNVRSKALHGAALSDDAENLTATRNLAAAVLAAAVEWRTHRQRMGDAAQRGDFLKELSDMQLSGQEVIGVPGDLNRFLPKRE